MGSAACVRPVNASLVLQCRKVLTADSTITQAMLLLEALPMALLSSCLSLWPVVQC